jgi:hypothetical protein
MAGENLAVVREALRYAKAAEILSDATGRAGFRKIRERDVRAVWEEEDVTTDKNKQVMRQFLEFINTASEKLAAELISPDAIFHVPGRSEPMRGPASYLAIIGTLEEMIAEGDKVAARFIRRGTHRGAFFGVPPTGRPSEVQAMNFYRLSGGQFVEERGQPDLLGLLQQIGALPST